MSVTPQRAPAHDTGARPPRRVAAFVTLAAWSLSACYSYVAPEGAPSHNAEVRVALTDAGTATMVGAVGPGIELIDGRLVRADADSVVLGVTLTTNRRGVETDWRGERIAVPRAAVSSFGVRRLSRGRTAAAVAAGAAALVAAAVGFNISGNPSGASGRPAPNPQ